MTTTFSRYEMFAVHVNYNNWSRDFLKKLFGNFFYAILCRFFVEKIKQWKKIGKIQKKGNVSFSIGKQ